MKTLQKTDPNKNQGIPPHFAPLGLILALLGLLSFVILLLVRGLESAGISQPADPTLLERATWISLSIVVLGLALTAFIDPERTRRFLSGRQVKYGSNAVIMLLAFVGILFFINLLAYQNPLSWDVTESQSNSLAPETINLLSSLPDTITARAYYTPQTDSTQVRKLFENFKTHANGKFDYQFINPDSNPLAAKQDGIDRDGTTVMQLGNAPGAERVSQADEQGLAITMIKLINPEKRVIYFLTGHGEADILQASDTSYSLIKLALENKNYTVKPINLANAGSMPADAKTLVIAGPQTSLSIEEVQLVKVYLDKGGALIVMAEPDALTKKGSAPDPLADLLVTWGITQQNDVVYDPQANPPLVVYADPLNYAQHPITDKLRGVNSVFFMAQSLLPAVTPPQDIQLTPLAKTYDNAWGETDMESIQSGQISFDKSKDLPGPLILAIAAENTASQARMVVFGNVQFAADVLYKQGNGEILLNAIDWTTQQEKLISLTPKNNTLRTYSPPGNLGLVSMILVSICVIPVLIIAGGIFAWVSRRKRG